MAEKHVNLTGN